MIGRISPWSTPSAPSRSGLHDAPLQPLHQASQGAGRTPTWASGEGGRKIRSACRPNPTLQAKYKRVATNRRRSQMRPSCVSTTLIPGSGLGDRWPGGDDARCFGKSGALSKASDTLLAVFTHRVENLNTFSPQWHVVGPYAEGSELVVEFSCSEYAIDDNLSRLR